MRKLSEEYYPRSYKDIKNLNLCANYIKENFERSGAKVSLQNYQVGKETYTNIIARFGTSDEDLVIVGAHYDSHDDTPGADDNASGVAGLIELAILLGKEDIHKNIELVAYCLEEPPFFRTNQMGSAIHAKSIQEQKINIKGVLVFEMIGYFTDKAKSQQYPIPLLKLFYPTTGDFIAIVGKMNQRSFAKKVKAGMKGTTPLDIQSINAPESLPGIDFSDHLNYWRYGQNAVMITDTAFHRTPHYHKDTDTADTLDYEKMSHVVTATYQCLKSL